MMVEEKYMWRCLQLAEKGKGYVSSNPMVGAVIVYNGKIIGEGFHRKYGESHAEVNAINSVADKSLLRKCVMYVSLEPCSHYGKTPPCAQLIIENKIPKIVIAAKDPYPEVSGRGIKILKEAGVEVITGILEKESKKQNKEFFASHIHKRPYVYLKWAQTKDGFIDTLREERNTTPAIISNDLTRIVVHKMRAEVSSIMVGTNTVLKDNPSLTTRYWYGKNPVRIVIDKEQKIPGNYNVLDDYVETIVFMETTDHEIASGKTRFMPLVFDETILTQILDKLNKEKINSVLVEGGSKLLQAFIDAGLWNEAFVEVADKKFSEGVMAPQLNAIPVKEVVLGSSIQYHYIR